MMGDFSISPGPGGDPFHAIPFKKRVLDEYIATECRRQFHVGYRGDR
jgi:hypothetical protein